MGHLGRLAWALVVKGCASIFEKNMIVSQNRQSFFIVGFSNGYSMLACAPIALFPEITGSELWRSFPLIGLDELD